MLLNMCQEKNISLKKRIETMINQPSTLNWNFRIGILGLALAASPLCTGALAQGAPSPQLKGPYIPPVTAPKPENMAPDPMTDPLDKVAAARKPESSVAVHNIVSALEAAYRNNTELKEYQTQVRSVDEKLPQALAGWRPTVYANASVGGEKDILSGDIKSGNGGQSVPSNGTTSSTVSANIQLQQNLFNGGKTVASTCQAESLVQAERARLADKESEVLFNAVRAYFAVIAKTAELEYKRSNEKSLRGMLGATRAKFEVGEETRTAIAQAEASLAQGTALRETAEASLLAAEATFEQVMGVRPGKLKKPGEPSMLPSGLKEAISLAKKNNPAILAALHQEKAARSEIKVNDADLLPKIDLQGQVSRQGRSNRYDSVFASGLKTNDFTTAQAVSVNLRVPLYEGGAIRGKTRELRETAEYRRIQIETSRRKIVQQLVEAWETYLAAKAAVKSYEIQVKGYEVSLEGTRQEMLVGSKILLDVLNEQQKLVNAQLQLVQAEQQYYQSAYYVLASIGRMNAMDLKLKVRRYDPRVHYHDVRNSW